VDLWTAAVALDQLVGRGLKLDNELAAVGAAEWRSINWSGED
jgi:hypothetical protein